ncbi:MAG TPA: DUF3108 domain-containing protein [Vicinamibacterales bacterium]|nr:DUF3108 domain-containing protein [Vicinamibacterales bacterium]
MLIRAAGVYLAAACVLTWPLITQLTTRLGAVEGAGDPYLNVWILGWGMQTWLTDPAAVFNGRVFDANIFHPSTGTLTFSDHLLLQSLVLSPLYAATGNLSLCYNVLLIGSIALSGLAMHALARAVSGSHGAAYIAGLAWACWPYRTAHFLHLQLQSLYFLPLALLALHRLAAARRWRDAVSLGVLAALQAVSSVYYGVMTAIAIGVGALSLAWTTGQWRGRRYWTRLFAAAAIGALLIAPIVWQYWITQQREGFGRNLFEAMQNSATLQSYTQVPHENLVYGANGLMLPRPPAEAERDRRNNEHQMFPGFVLLALATFGAIKAWGTDAWPTVTTAIALAVAGVVLSLGPEGASAVYERVASVVFGFHAIRAPARFAIVAMLGLSLMAAIGLARTNLGPRVLIVIAALMMLEYLNAPLKLVAAPEAGTNAGRWLRDQRGRGAVLYLPVSLDKDNSIYMVQSLEHRRPIVNGYSGQRPAYFTSIADAFADPSSVDARATLKELEVRFVVSPEPLASADRPESPYVERETFGDLTVYEVVWTETSEAALEDVNVPPPPPPGPAPFSVGETATYSVQWLTGPLDLPAGTIVLTVVPPDAGDVGVDGARPAWVFEAAAETAPWVSRFFEAKDRFRTSADSLLTPLLHQRFLREGRRAVDRAFAYDHEARHVRSADSAAAAREATAMALPLAAHARDSLTGLWYARTLPLAAGSVFEVPINEAGRNQKATIRVGAPESIATPGGPRFAFPVRPQLTARVQRRQGIDATIWISADRQRVPLQADITAGFGRVLLKLVDYRP